MDNDPADVAASANVVKRSARFWPCAASLDLDQRCQRPDRVFSRTIVAGDANRLVTMTSLRILAALLIAGLAFVGRADAGDIEGAWATNDENCGKVFENKNGQTVLSQDSDIYGGGFVIDGDRITGKMARCTIKSRKTVGDTMHLLAACATDIMFSSVQFSLRLPEDGRLVRIFPGMDDIQINYRRCRL